MSALFINPASKTFWTRYITTAQYEAGQILNAKVSEAAYAKKSQHIAPDCRPIVLNYTDRSWNWDWSSRQTTVVHPPRPQVMTAEEEKKEQRAHRAKIAGSLISIGGAFLAGYTYQAYARHNKTLQITQEVYNASRSIPGSPAKTPIKSLVYHQLQIDQLNCAKVNNYFYATIALLTGGALIATGGFAVIPWMITAGEVTLVASAIIAALNLGLHWNDGDEIRKYAAAIAGHKGQHGIGLADDALIKMINLDERMLEVRASAPPPPYEALYPDLYHPSAPPLHE